MDSIRFTEVNPSPNGRQAWVLVYLVGSLGDTIVCIPALEAIRRQFPDDKIVLLHDYQTLVPVSPLDVVPKTLVDASLSYVMHSAPVPKLRELWRLRKRIRRENVKAVIYLVASERFGKLVWRDKLFFQLCGVKNLVGFYPFDKEKLYERDEQSKPILQPSEAVLKLERIGRDGVSIENLNFTERLLEFSEAEKARVKNWLDERRKKPSARLVAMCPGCKRKANDWGVENFIEIGRRLIAEDDFEIVIVGGKAETPLAEQMIAAWNGAGIDATGVFKANESGALFANCEFMFGNDTGTTHLAAAAGIPCFAVYHFRDNPGHWFPLGKGHLLVQHETACAGCHLTECPIPEHPCMTGIKVDDVWRLLKEFISEKSEKPFRRVLV